MTYEELLPGDLIYVRSENDPRWRFELVTAVMLQERLVKLILLNLTEVYSSGRVYVTCHYPRRMTMDNNEHVLRDGVKIT